MTCENCPDWRVVGDMGVKGEPLARTEENFNKIILMHDELIHEQKEEIAKLKMKINRLQQRLGVV
jgi:hypothetical protein